MLLYSNGFLFRTKIQEETNGKKGKKHTKKEVRLQPVKSNSLLERWAIEKGNHEAEKRKQNIYKILFNLNINVFWLMKRRSAKKGGSFDYIKAVSPKKSQNHGYSLSLA